MSVRALVIAEHDGSRIAAATRAAVGAARALAGSPPAGTARGDRAQFPGEVAVLVLAADGTTLAHEAAGIGGVDRVLVAESAGNVPCLAAVWAPQVAALAAGFTHLLAPATTFGKDLLPRVAGLIGVGALSDITGIADARTFTRPVYAGNAIETVTADASGIVCATVRPTAFAAPAAAGPAAIERVRPDVALPTHTRFVSRGGGTRAGPALETATRVVAGGRGLGDASGFALLERLAAALGAAVGASRAAVDAGWVTNDLQVGQTGKIIAPELYVAVGISGAIQHLTGIKDAGTIVAINRDAEAPICRLADLVLVADLNEAVPALVAALEARRDSA